MNPNASPPPPPGKAEQAAALNENMRKQVRLAVEYAKILAETIKEATEQSDLKGIPSGHLYAMVMSHIDFPLYQMLISTLEDGRLIKHVGHLLVYIGPLTNQETQGQ